MLAAMFKGRRQLVVSLPALLGVSLVLVYVFGVLNAAGAFAKAHIPQTALRLLSVEQLLVRGISILAQPGVALIILLMGSSVAIFEISHHEVRSPISPARKAMLNRKNRRFGTAYLLGSLAILVTRPWEEGLSLAPLLVVPIAMILVAKRGLGHKFSLRHFNGLYAAAALASLLVGSYLLPLPQPNISIQKPHSKHLKGVLVTHVDAVWYAWQQSHKDVAAVPDPAIRRVNLTYPSPTVGHSAATLFIDLIF